MTEVKKTNKGVLVKTGLQNDFFANGGQFPETDDFFSSEGQLSCDVFSDEKNIIVKSTMAGVYPKNLDISVSNDLLTIRGFREARSETEETDFYAREIYWGAFSRSIVLPQAVDQNKVSATLKNGVLTIILPKKYRTTAIKVKHLKD